MEDQKNTKNITTRPIQASLFADYPEYRVQPGRNSAEYARLMMSKWKLLKLATAVCMTYTPNDDQVKEFIDYLVDLEDTCKYIHYGEENAH